MASQSGVKHAHKTDDEDDICVVGSLVKGEGKVPKRLDSVLSEKLYPAIAILNTIATRSEYCSTLCLQCGAHGF